MNNSQKVCDSQRIELFLQQQLSDQEQIAFESHLDDCSHCRDRLEATAAGEDVWSGVRDSLLGQQLTQDCFPSGHSAPDAATASGASFSHDTVLKLLAPTDDDRMIGRLGTYEVVGVIGSGGMGVVLKAFDAALNRYVAIKVLAPHLGNSGAARKRFSREAQAAAAVVHDNVIEIHGVADVEGLPYLVMAYVRGPSLQSRLDDEGPLALVEVLRIAVQAATGLAAAHAQGLVHRDVKPANILLADGVERVKLTDFGLARAADDASLTKTGFIAGTPQYMSPEQARGESVDQRSDLFSLGSVLYTLCTGRAPFRAETSYGVLRRITDEEPRPIREINPDIPAWLCQIISKLMSKHPHDRIGSAREVAELLEECLAHVQQPTTVRLPHGRFSFRQENKSKRVSFPAQVMSHFPTPLVFQRRAGLGFTFAMLFAGILFAGILIVLELNKGVLSIESEADGVPLRIMQGEQVVKQLTISRMGASVRIAAGQYVVETKDETDGITVENGTVKLQRGGREVVRIVKDDRSSVDNKYLGHGLRVTFPAELAAREPAVDVETLDGKADVRGGANDLQRYVDEANAAAEPPNPGDFDSLLSDDRLYGYRDFLWGSLRSLQQRRSSLLTGITETEQQLVVLRQPIEIPEGAEAKMRTRLEREKKRQTIRITEFSARMKHLRAELDDVERQIALLKKKLEETSGPGANNQIAFEADVVGVSDAHVEISAGTDDGARQGMRMPVFRDKSYVGEIEIVKTAADKSVAKILNQDSQSPIRPGDRASMLMESGASRIIGKDPGEPIYNNRLRRFKFRLEKVDVTSAAEIAEEFWVRYRGRGNPPITGVWGDPRTNSLVVVGPTEADQAIRDTIARWEGLRIGINMQEDAFLEIQLQKLENTRRTALEQVARRKLEIIEAEARETPDADQLKVLNRKLQTEMAELEIAERKLRVIRDSLERLQGNGLGHGNASKEHLKKAPGASNSPRETRLWHEYGVTPGPVTPLTAKMLEWLGLHLSPITNDRFRDKNVFAKYLGGLDVAFVRSHGPAEKAGIHEVDIVVKLQGRAVASLKDLDSAMQLAIEQIKRQDAGSLQFDVLRSGETFQVNVSFSVRDHDPLTLGSNDDSTLQPADLPFSILRAP